MTWGPFIALSAGLIAIVVIALQIAANERRHRK